MIRIHDRRHTCASLLLVQGVHPTGVMETLGHSQISLTIDAYPHVLRRSSRRRPVKSTRSSPRELRCS
jgi:integrase